MAYLNVLDKIFHKSYEGDVSKAIDGVREKMLKQSGSLSHIVLACYVCAVAAHGESYLNEKCKFNWKWRNAADLSKGRHHKVKLDRVLHTRNQEQERKGLKLPPAKDIMNVMRDGCTAKATDWVSKVVSVFFSLYGCLPE